MTTLDRQGELCVERLALSEVAARFGTPCYVYSKAAIVDAFKQYRDAFGARDHLILYAVKANSNIAILKLLAGLGSGFDIVSGGELARVLKAGADPAKIVFSGVGKSAEEIRQALAVGIHCFNVESEPELERLSQLAHAAGASARISLRVNPDVDAQTHPYISTGLRQDKFGVPHECALEMYRKARRLPGLRVTGIDCHIGSQLTQTGPFAAALERVLQLADALRADGFDIEHLDLGGGLGIRYQPEERPPTIAEYVATFVSGLADRSYRIMVEPGRSMVGNAGLLLTRVEYVKPTPERRFVIVDAAMNDLVRPALYDAWHEIRPVRRGAHEAPRVCQVVGPVCESGDFLGRDRMLAVAAGELLAVMSAGAYGMSMSSNYNSRPRAAEVMIDGAHAHLVRSRESIEELFARESFLPE
ncbi:MAG: diaminopimelate decarboxylase [Betaproteobacteria bacterium]|nr:MAG: diaminopimelate decarboxylase [Betaproteobacteria bacterium]